MAAYFALNGLTVRCVCCVFVGISASAARATPTGNPLPGPSGLGIIPTTQTVAPGAFEGSLNYERVSIDEDAGGGSARLAPFGNLTYGLKRAEIGVAYAHERTESQGFGFGTDYFALHGKYRLFERGGAALAVGAHYYDFGKESGFDLGSTSTIYATGTYEFNRESLHPVRLHGGILGQRFKTDGFRQSYGRPFAGLELAVTPELSLAADYLSSDGDAARARTLSLRYQPEKDKLSAQIGVGKLRSDFKFFAGFTFRFGG